VGGTSIFRVEDSDASDPSIFIDNLNLKDLTIEGTLTMGSNGKITNDSNIADFVVNQKGFSVKATSGSGIATGPESKAYQFFDDQRNNLVGTQEALQAVATVSFQTFGNWRLNLQSQDITQIRAANFKKVRFSGVDSNLNVYESFEFDFGENLLRFMNPRTSHPTKSEIENGSGGIYIFEGNENSDDIELWAVAQNYNSGNIDYNKLAG